MAPNSPTSLKEMREQMARLQEAIKEAEKHQRVQAIGQITELMYANEITLEDIQNALKPARKRGKGQGKPPAKYRDPESGAEWSGQGRAPAWIREVEDREQFAI
jgi:DNA-binding protein H-NS